MALPTFVGVGPGRSGTSWLYEMLSAHPGVAMAKGTKETEFFNNQFHRGRQWYEDFFDATCAVRGEITQRYVFNPLVARRMADLVPEAKLIITLRSPIERMASVYGYRTRVGTYRVPLAQAISEDSSLVRENQYDLILRPFFELFPRVQILLCFYDDLERSPTEYLKNVLRFIGASEDILPPNAHAVVNPAAVARSPILATTSRKVATMLRHVGLYSLLTGAKRSQFIRRLIVEPVDSTGKLVNELPRALSVDLCRAFQPGVEWLQKETGRDLSHWLDAGKLRA